ncbi:YHR003C and YKL027W [Zygosaccharomyces parabailii]|uniref:ZYBA0S05-05952g1_1 n=1 Tax=Zygosaccharomyces bailii (strain CLIB 213 / ATCC 58445 / CBS 680 / BCRC 21525 / NBRC 1098 / NCYC 1416 / NRRL Y-2227) TaxID=1333698 RepID=A0A8J2X907_ZYGB2|nr:YHR003C and YKL027W [Zygosaccharomyces parabailii]CDF89972.1 ZYBA0S05-05952g1_1 [Zygosaccharomyces bailii CLIB 213]CDH17728.1 related to E.coli molybdopterin-converting factor chlN [Zygosaccharomyces bailii ISA1307]
MVQETWKVVAVTAAFTLAATKCIELILSRQQPQQPTSNRHKAVVNRRYDDNLFREQLARNYAFLGEEGMQKLKEQYIVVVGAGGVGSWVVTMLVRSGCCHIRVIDFDQISLSSLNRHSCATLKDVGTPKVECLKQHMLGIAPWCKLEAINKLWNKESAEQLLFSGGRPTIVVDCIDNIETKVDLLEYCHKSGLEVISSMGASTKSDPTRVNIGDITATEEDPLARCVRRLLKKRGITTGIPVVFSAEKPDPRKAKLLPLPDEEYEKGQVGELSALKDFRVRILPVLGTMPGIFGLTIATWIITKVSGYPMNPIEGKNRIKIYDGIYQSLAGQMSRIGMPTQRVPVSVFEIGYILEEVFRGKSPISGYSTKLTLSKWDPSKDVSLQNVVILTKEEQREHERRVLNGGEKLEDVYSQEVLDLVNKRFKEEQYYSQYR